MFTWDLSLLANNTPIVWKEVPLEKKIMTIVFYNEKALLTVEVADSSCFFPTVAWVTRQRSFTKGLSFIISTKSMLNEERPCNIFGQFLHSCCLVYIKGRLSLLLLPAKPVDWDCWSLIKPMMKCWTSLNSAAAQCIITKPLVYLSTFASYSLQP